MSTRVANTPGQGLQIQEIAPSDLEEVARFITRISGSDTPIPRATERLIWILLENPARALDDPLGWLLRAGTGEIVGCMCCAPQKFRLAQKTFTLMMANSFYVDERHRGSGTSILLRYLQLGSRYPLFVSSANATVAEMWEKLGGYPLGNSQEELLRILRLSPLAAESVYRKTNSNLLAGMTAILASLRFGRNQFSGSANGELFPLITPEEAAALCAGHHSGKLTSCRDLPYLKWRYLSSSDRTTRLFAFHLRGGAGNPWMVAVRLQNRGYKHQIRALHVLDVWGEPDPGANLYLSIAAALCHEYREKADVLIFRCLPPGQKKILTEHGFKARTFAAPLAWCIDKHNLLPTADWYFVPADGDMFL